MWGDRELDMVVDRDVDDGVAGAQRVAMLRSVLLEAHDGGQVGRNGDM